MAFSRSRDASPTILNLGSVEMSSSAKKLEVRTSLTSGPEPGPATRDCGPRSIGKRTERGETGRQVEVPLAADPQEFDAERPGAGLRRRRLAGHQDQSIERLVGAGGIPGVEPAEPTRPAEPIDRFPERQRLGGTPA